MTQTLSTPVDASREAFRIRHNAEIQLANVGITALNLASVQHPELHQAADALFKGDQHQMGLWFAMPNPRTGLVPMDECRDGKAQELTTRLNFARALSMM